MTASATADLARIAQQLHAAGFLVTLDFEVESAGAAMLLGVTPKTLRNWRSELNGPAWHVRRGHVFYRLEDVLAWTADIGTQASLLTTDSASTIIAP